MTPERLNGALALVIGGLVCVAIPPLGMFLFMLWFFRWIDGR